MCNQRAKFDKTRHTVWRFDQSHRNNCKAFPCIAINAGVADVMAEGAVLMGRFYPDVDAATAGMAGMAPPGTPPAEQVHTITSNFTMADVLARSRVDASRVKGFKGVSLIESHPTAAAERTRRDADIAQKLDGVKQAVNATKAKWFDVMVIAAQ